MARSVIDASAECEKQIPGLGFQFIQDIASICGKEKHEPHHEQLLQKLSEVLVLRQLLNLEWPEGTTFQHEPAVSATGKRPELRVVTPERGFLRIPLMADSDSTFIADNIPCDGGHPALVS